MLRRRRYLRDIKRYRAEGKTICCLDEVRVDAGHTKENIWQDQVC